MASTILSIIFAGYIAPPIKNCCNLKKKIKKWVCQKTRCQKLLMNVYETKQIYYSMLYKTYIDYDIARRNYIWRLFEIIIKWRRLMFVLFLLDSSRHLCSFGKWKKCKKYMRHLSGTFSAFVVWLSRFFGLSYTKESGKRHYPDGKNDKNCTIITSHQWSMISKKSAVFTRLVHIH